MRSTGEEQGAPVRSTGEEPGVPEARLPGFTVEPKIWKYGTSSRYVGGALPGSRGHGLLPRPQQYMYAFDRGTFGEGTFGEQAHSIFFMESSHKYGNLEPVHLTSALWEGGTGEEQGVPVRSREYQ